MDAPLFSDGQVAVIASAIGGAALVIGGSIGGALKWLGGRLVKSIDDVTAESKRVRDEVIELKGEVKEGRADIGEIRDRLNGVPPQDHSHDRPPPRRPRSDPSLPRVRRPGTEGGP